MNGADFFDTNILIYALDSNHDKKHGIANEMVGEACALNSGVISYQVVQEGLNLLTGKFVHLAKPSDVQTLLLQVWMPMMKVMPSQRLFEQAISTKSRYQFSFYDSLIVAAAQTAGCKRLLTEDMQHGQVIDGLKIINPFV